MLSAAKKTAKLKGLDFNLMVEDVSIPEVCPVLGLTLTRGTGYRSDSSPSLDRVIPSRGYVKGNIVVVSMRANRIKNDATIAELKKITQFYSKLTAKD